MSCTGRYAEAWQFASFWCKKSLLVGADYGGAIAPAPPNAFLTADAYTDFLAAGVRANVGMVLYNTTRNLSGVITAVTETLITATGVTWYNGEFYRLVAINAAEQAQIEHWMNITAGDIHAALASVDACGCTLSAWGANFLAEVNIILARIFYDCPCSPSLSDADKQRYQDLVTARLDDIRTGKTDVCSGATGANFPQIGWAEVAWNDFVAAEIIEHEEERGGPP